jgi:hypothetical protein
MRVTGVVVELVLAAMMTEDEVRNGRKAKSGKRILNLASGERCASVVIGGYTLPYAPSVCTIDL